jgi:hypothetical protein
MRTLGDRIADGVSAKFPCDDFDLRQREAASGFPHSSQEPAPDQVAVLKARIVGLEHDVKVLRSGVAAAHSAALAEAATVTEVVLEAVGQHITEMVDQVYSKVDASIMRSATDMHTFIAHELGQMKNAVDEAIGNKRKVFKFAGEPAPVEPAPLDGEVLPPPRSWLRH